MKYLQNAAGCLGAMVLIAGCGASQPSPPGSAKIERSIKREGKPEVDIVANEDAAMNAAIAKARASVPTFIKALRSPKPGQRDFAVKKRFDHAGGGEHMWIAGLSFDGKAFHGRLNNDPVHVQGLKAGDKASATPAEVSDWMYTERGKLIGGATIRALYNAMSPAEQEALRKQSGYQF